MSEELARMIEDLIRMRERAEKQGLLGVVGYLNGALGNLQGCVRDYDKHWERHVSLKGLIFTED